MASTPPLPGPSAPNDTAGPPAKQDAQEDVILFFKTLAEVSWTRPTPDAAPTSQHASLSIRHNAGLTEAFLTLRFTRVWLGGEQHSTTFFTNITPESIDSLSLIDTGDSYRLDFRMRQSPSLFGPNGTWEGVDEAQTATLQRLYALAQQRIFAVAVRKHGINKAQLKAFCAAVSNGSMKPISSLYITARYYGGKGARLHSIRSSALLHPPPYVPAASSAASDNASAPAYENKGQGNRSQSTTGESTRRPHKRARLNPEAEAESTGCRKCDELFPFLTKQLGGITTHLKEIDRSMNVRMAAVEAHLAAQAKARAAADGARSALVKEERESLAHEVTKMTRSHFVETVTATVNAEMDVLSKTVGAQIDAEMNCVYQYVEQLEKQLEEQLKEYIAGGMRAEGKARVPLEPYQAFIEREKDLLDPQPCEYDRLAIANPLMVLARAADMRLSTETQGGRGG